jgi:hypothetical protein
MTRQKFDIFDKNFTLRPSDNPIQLHRSVPLFLGEADPAKKEESPDNHLTVGEKRSLYSNVLQDTLGTGTNLAGAEGIFGPEIVGILRRNKVYPHRHGTAGEQHPKQQADKQIVQSAWDEMILGT